MGCLGVEVLVPDSMGSLRLICPAICARKKSSPRISELQGSTTVADEFDAPHMVGAPKSFLS
jgi:hypothetical protein